MNCANHPDRERVAFCQNCGKPLCSECTRTVGSAVFCEPCLAARLAAAEAAAAGAVPPSAGPAYTGAAADYTAPGASIPPPSAPSEPNPGLAALLGFIPGVGAMYNGQYAKGIVHLVVFACLVSLADHSGIFGMFVAGWVLYQVIEAHHTARARRDGTPLPNPFGLNDVGERFGFGRNWGNSAAYAEAPGTPVPPPAGPGVPPAGYAGYAPPQTPYSPYTPPVSSWGAPTESYAYAPPPAGGAFTPDAMPYTPAPRSRFPLGAIWLIALGVIFLVGNVGIFRHVPVHFLIPFFLIGFGVWMFVRRMTSTGVGLTDDGSSNYQYRIFCALRGSAWVILVGILFLLNTFNILSWGRSWPFFIILGGVMTLLQRAVHPVAPAMPYPYAPYPPVPPSPTSAPSSPVTSIVPSSTPEGEGK